MIKENIQIIIFVNYNYLLITELEKKYLQLYIICLKLVFSCLKNDSIYLTQEATPNFEIKNYGIDSSYRHHKLLV